MDTYRVLPSSLRLSNLRYRGRFGTSCLCSTCTPPPLRRRRARLHVATISVFVFISPSIRLSPCGCSRQCPFFTCKCFPSVRMSSVGFPLRVPWCLDASSRRSHHNTLPHQGKFSGETCGHPRRTTFCSLILLMCVIFSPCGLGFVSGVHLTPCVTACHTVAKQLAPLQQLTQVPHAPPSAPPSPASVKCLVWFPRASSASVARSRS